MNVALICMLEGVQVVLFRPYWLAYDYPVFRMLGDHGWYSPIDFGPSY